jgi:ankyrin repeat protein/Tol biopolymer transport system component
MDMNLESDRPISRLRIAAAALLGLVVLGGAAGVLGSAAQAGQGPYFGQKPPGTTPQIFAPGIVSTPAHEFACSFSPDGKEFYFTRRETRQSPTLIMVSGYIDGLWTVPEPAPFNDKFAAREGSMSFEPMVSPDGRRLYFSSDRSLPGQAGPGGPPMMNIWYVEREGGRWGVPQNPGPPFNPMKAMYISTSNMGTIYTTDISDGMGNERIAVARRVGGLYQQLERLRAPINVGTGNMYPYIAPDESYLIFSRRSAAQNAGSSLLVSFRSPDGTWGEPKAIDLGNLSAGVPTISPDGKYLFFTAGERGRSDIYWVEATFLKNGSVAQSSAEIFDTLRKGNIQAVKALVEKTPQLVDARDREGMTPLHHAAMGGDTELINYLIEKGAGLELQDAHHKTPLHLAAVNDRKGAVAALLQRRAALETRDDYGRTALILCARERGQAATGRILIEAGADVSAADKFGDNALSLSVWRGKAEFVDLLVEKGALVPESGPRWRGMLSEAASKGLSALFRRLTDKAQDLKAADPSGEFLLHSASAGGSPEIVGLLVDKGFDPARPNRLGWTPLHYAARDGRTDAARILVARGAPLNARTIMGQTAYNVALERKTAAVAGLLAEKGADKSDIQFPVLKGDYLGQTPPGDKPELFAPGIISSIWGLHSTAVFSPDGSEVYWKPMITYPGETYSRGGLLMMKRVNGRWTAPAPVPFSGPDANDDVPFFSADGKMIYFISRRPLPGESRMGNEKIWQAERTPTGWSEPRPLDPNVNSVDMHWEFSLDREENLYFAGQPPDSRGMSDIYMARFSSGRYERPVNLGNPVNSAGAETTPFIAPDGSYLLFSRQYDICVSFRSPGGVWSEPVNLGPEVNSPGVELCPMVTADGKYLFFLSQRDGENHAYWVRADVIEKLRPVEKKK